MKNTFNVIPPLATVRTIYTTADVVAARLQGTFLTEEQKQIPLMEQHGFVIEYGSKDDIRFRRGQLHVWRILKRDQFMWQTAILKNGYYQDHIPVTSLEHVIKTYKR